MLATALIAKLSTKQGQSKQGAGLSKMFENSFKIFIYILMLGPEKSRKHFILKKIEGFELLSSKFFEKSPFSYEKFIPFYI